MAENYKNIKDIQKKYGENIFRMAITHLYETGAKAIQEVDIEKECKKIIDETPESAIMTGELQADILRCAAELSKLPLWDVLRFVQTDIQIYGATVHPGVIIEFRRNASGKEIFTCVVPPDTDDETIEEVTTCIEKRITEHSSEKGAYRLPYEDFIKEGFKEFKIRPQAIVPDKTICL